MNQATLGYKKCHITVTIRQLINAIPVTNFGKGYTTMFQVSIWSLRNLVAAFSDRLSRAHLPNVTTSHEVIDAWKLRILCD